MVLGLENVFDEYPNPFYIIRPVMNSEKSDDFEYIYVNRAFCNFISRKKEEIIGHMYREIFGSGEQEWFDLFTEVTARKLHKYIDYISNRINKMIHAEVFYIAPDLCACIIHNTKSVPDAKAKVQGNYELWYKANFDWMTGFYNRFSLQEIHEDATLKEKLGITYLDVNNLKTINDTLGHAAGDTLIIKIADMIKEHYKDSVVFRVGGDEFVVVTTGMEKAEFLKLSEEGKKMFEESNLAAIGYQYYEKVDDLQACIEACDRLMYKNKN
jgi:diguanylate cyclase (GGDEF)-like protein